MSELFRLYPQESGAAEFAATNKGLEDFKKDLDQDFYILDHVPELLSQMAKTGQPATIKVNGHEEQVSFYMIYQAMESFSNLKATYTKVLGAEHLDKDVKELDKALKTALSGYNKLEIPVGEDAGGHVNYKQLQYIDPKTGAKSPANAWELLQSWKEGGKSSEHFYVHIDRSDTNGGNIDHEKWAHGCGGLGDQTCKHGDHTSTGHQAPDAQHPDDNRYISVTRHEDGCGNVNSWDVYMSAGQVASSLLYENSSDPNYNGEKVFDSFFASKDW